MKAKLIENRGMMRIYELNEPITIGSSDWFKEVDINERMSKFISKRIKPEYRELATNEYGGKCIYVLISDAVTHTERLAFPVIKINDSYVRASFEIAGEHANMIEGGNPNKVYPDEWYFRQLALINNLNYEGIEA